MVMVGGITRLTHSGLSMVDWHLIMGVVPPMSGQEWSDAFEKYKQFPEYQQLNTHYTLSEFKSIFYWEYIHRLLGRLIGMAFVIPFLVFLIQKRFDRRLLFRTLLLFALGAFQGFLGWFMVKSGLVDRPSVSHFRLAAHLLTAFLICIYIAWLVLDIKKPCPAKLVPPNYPKAVRILLVLVVVQIIYGAFVAGLKAGFFYPTFPMMQSQWFPEQIKVDFQRLGAYAFVNSITTVQFIHRWLGTIIFFFVVAMKLGYRRSLVASDQRNLNLLLSVVTLQVILGIGTLVMHVPIGMAVVHQVMALILLIVVIINLHPWRQVPWRQS